MSTQPPAQDSRALWAWLERASTSGRRIEVWPDGALHVAADMADSPHRGFHASIKIGLTGSFEVRTDAQPEPEQVSAVMFNSSIKHSTNARGVIVAALLIDPESEEYAKLAHWFSGKHARPHDAKSMCRLPDELATRLREAVVARLLEGDSFTSVWEYVVAQLADEQAPPPQRDARIQKTAAYLKENFVSPPPVAELAARVNLSDSRLVHLFTATMGVSLRTYVHWLRMRDVVYAVAGGESLTIAAHRAGFSDLPHLTRKFRDLFGEPPSSFARGASSGSVSFVHRINNQSPHTATDAPRIEGLLRSTPPARAR